MHLPDTAHPPCRPTDRHPPVGPHPAGPPVPAGPPARAEPLTAADRETALHGLLVRTRALHTESTESGDRYPLYADRGRWTWSRRGSWTPGFWSGLLDLATRTGVLPAGTAEAAAARLAPRLVDDTVTRAMTFWYGARTAGTLRTAAAERLLDSRMPSTGLVPVGSAWGAGARGRAALEVDCWAPLIRLLCRTGSGALPEGRDTAAALARHALSSALTERPGGRIAVFGRLRADRSGALLPDAPPTHGDRASAWALLGLTEAAAHLPPAGETGRLARHCAEAALRMSTQWPDPADTGTDTTTRTTTGTGTGTGTDITTGPGTRPTDTGTRATTTGPSAPPADTSADAIVAVARLKLAALGHPGCLDAADGTLARLVRHHVTPATGPTATGGPTGGAAFTGTRYRIRPGPGPGSGRARTASVESVWGTFFLAHALAVRLGVLPAGEL
ncbi:hypothetical protein [Streptomyces griseus]|uniref:hypothetical protein n=1 Tax=Streptomyces griseus TaxID=1911 RepID=UPI0033F6545A